MKIPTHLLFVYGTLSDAEMRSNLFAAVVPAAPATLKNYRLRSHEGFLFASPYDGSSIEGLIISLTSEQLRIADAWEDVPVYTRTKVLVTCSHRRIEACTYARPGIKGTRATSSEICSFSKEEVLLMIQDFRLKMFGGKK